MSHGKKLKIIWLTWEKQIRNRSMSKELAVPLFEVLTERSGYIRYMSCISRTLAILWSEKPNIVICQNPSIVLTILLLGLRGFFRFKVSIDAHFGGIDASNGSKASQQILDWCNRVADLVIVTNESHADQVRSLEGRAFVCPDPLPDLSAYNHLKKEFSKKVFLICSYDVDEPFKEVFKAAELLVSEGFRFFVSGNYRKARIFPDDHPWLKLLGFVSEEEFYKHLFSSQLVIDLTDNDNCLVCGAYEALAAGKPLILSRKNALQEYFTNGTIFTENQAMDIAVAVRAAYSERERLVEEGYQWVLRTRDKMREDIGNLNKLLQNL